MIVTFEGHTPQIAEGVFVAPTATIIGRVRIEAGASIWYGAVLRGDTNDIVIGAGANVQDNCVIHTNGETDATIIGTNVTLGHGVTLEGCRIGAGALIGMNAVVLGGATVGDGTMIAAGSVVAAGATIPPGVLAAGAPVIVKKELSGAAKHAVETGATNYHNLRDRYLAAWLGDESMA